MLSIASRPVRVKPERAPLPTLPTLFPLRVAAGIARRALVVEMAFDVGGKPSRIKVSRAALLRCLREMRRLGCTVVSICDPFGDSRIICGL